MVDLTRPLEFRPDAVTDDVTIAIGGQDVFRMAGSPVDDLPAQIDDVVNQGRQRQDRGGEIVLQASVTLPFWSSIVPAGPHTRYTLSLWYIAGVTGATM